LVINSELFAQIIYSGIIENHRVNLVVSDKFDKAYFTFDKIEKPIFVYGRCVSKMLLLNGTLDSLKQNVSIYSSNFDSLSANLNVSIEFGTIQKFKGNLKKEFNIRELKESTQYELLESKTTNSNYFKLLLLKENNEIQLKRINVFDKKSDKLLQSIDMNYSFSQNNLEVFDYNFDGIEDFSLVERISISDTCRVYFFKISQTNQYFKSEISGCSLKFNSDLKTIEKFEGIPKNDSIVVFETTTFILKNNNLFQVDKKCQEFNGHKGEYINIKCEKNKNTSH